MTIAKENKDKNIKTSFRYLCTYVCSRDREEKEERF